MYISNEVIKGTKKIVDMATLLTKGAAMVLSNTDLQHKNQFEVLFSPFSWSLDPTVLLDVAADNVITKLYVQTIEATFVSFTYERADNIQYVKDVEYPESVTMTFLEDELGTVRDWVNRLAKSVAVVDSEGMFVFAANQNASKKNAIVMPLMKTGIPSGAWIQFTGLKYMSTEAITLDQSSPENMIISVTFVCDNCWWKTPF